MTTNQPSIDGRNSLSISDILSCFQWFVAMSFFDKRTPYDKAKEQVGGSPSGERETFPLLLRLVRSPRRFGRRNVNSTDRSIVIEPRTQFFLFRSSLQNPIEKSNVSRSTFASMQRRTTKTPFEPLPKPSSSRCSLRSIRQNDCTLESSMTRAICTQRKRISIPSTTA